MSDAEPLADPHAPGAAEKKLVHMANQIAKFFASQPSETAVDGIAGHIRKFWDPRMRSKITAHAAAGGVGLDPLTRAAIDRLAK